MLFQDIFIVEFLVTLNYIYFSETETSYLKLELTKFISQKYFRKISLVNLRWKYDYRLHTSWTLRMVLHAYCLPQLGRLFQNRIVIAVCLQNRIHKTEIDCRSAIYWYTWCRDVKNWNKNHILFLKSHLITPMSFFLLENLS